MAIKLTTEEFIKKAKEIHSDKYDYSKVNYINYKTPICIVCPKHGEFWQIPRNHLRGNGCSKCSSHKFSTEDILKRLKNIHPNLEFLSFEYVNNKQKISFKCPIHGIQTKPISKLLDGRGCPKCRKKVNIIKEKKRHINWTQETWINKCKLLFQNKYKYDNVIYKNNKVKVEIYCTKKDKNGNDHGYFKIRPNNLIDTKQGCTKCAKEKLKAIALKKRITTEEFVKKAKEIHMDKYDYSKVIYNGRKQEVCIICPEHGEFWQTPNSHLNNEGCPKCNQSHMEKDIDEFLKNNDIKFEYQKRFKWLRQQSLDFYLPDYNVAIECQGIQHFKPIDFFEKLNVIQQRDNLKKQLCEENGIKLLYYSNLGIEYPYEVFEDKDELLKEINNLA